MACAAGIDKIYSIDRAAADKLDNEHPWMRADQPKYFRRVLVNAPAAMKMLAHASAGVEQGLKGVGALPGKPKEVMGLLHGHISTDEPGTIVVTDAFELPIEGFETKVEMTAEAAIYQTVLQTQLEMVRVENFVGWYHSHPFEVQVDSNAFFSHTDVLNQRNMQLSTDGKAVGIVIDPLRGLAKERPEMLAFRTYPDAHSAPDGVGPDGKTFDDENRGIKRWGPSYRSYYELEVKYEAPPLTLSLLSVIARDSMWMKVLSSTPSLEKETLDYVPGRISTVGAVASKTQWSSPLASSRAAAAGAMGSSALTARSGAAAGDLAVAARELAVDFEKSRVAQDVKSAIFSTLATRAAAGGCGCGGAHPHAAHGAGGSSAGPAAM